MTTPHRPTPAAPATQPTSYHEDTGPYASRGTWLVLAASSVVQSADVLLAKNTFDVAARDSERVSWFIAIGVATAATLLAFTAGKERRKGSRVTHRIYVALWALLGCGMAMLRIAQPLMEGGYVDPGEGLLAVFILLLYLVAGAKIMQTAYDITNPKRSQLLAAQREERKTARALVKVEAAYARVNDTLALWQKREAGLVAAHAALTSEASVHGVELKHRSRNEVAAILGRAEATVVYRRETWPEQRHDDRTSPGADPAVSPAPATS